MEIAYISFYTFTCIHVISYVLQAYTEGKDCSQCKPGYFYPEKSNAQGCRSCYCMGITDQCVSSKYYRDQASTSGKPHSLCFSCLLTILINYSKLSIIARLSLVKSHKTYLCSALLSPLYHSKNFAVHPVHSNNNSIPLGIFQSCCNHGTIMNIFSFCSLVRHRMYYRNGSMICACGSFLCYQT